MSAAELEQKLSAKGFSEEERADVLATLERTGLLDDERYAITRASTLAARGSGDALIRHELEQAGIGPDVIEAAIAELDPERKRACRIVERRGDGPKTRRYLAGKGFSEDAIESAVVGSGDCR